MLSSPSFTGLVGLVANIAIITVLELLLVPTMLKNILHVRMKRRHERVNCLTNKHADCVKISRAHLNIKVFWLFTCNPSTCEVEMKNPQANLAGLISQVCELQIQVLDHHQWTSCGEWPWKTTNINLWLLQLLTSAGTGAQTFKSIHTHTQKKLYLYCSSQFITF